METSDSEYFESADEEFATDHNDVKVTSTSKTTQKIKDERFKEVTVKQAKVTESDYHKQNVIESRLKVTHENEADKKEDEEAGKHKASKCEPKNQKRGGRKLGQKLGSRVDHSVNIDNFQSSTSLKSEKNTEDELNRNELVSKEDNLWNDNEVDWADSNTRLNSNNELEKHFETGCSLKSSQQDNSESADIGSGWGDWGSWNVSSILSTATNSVSTITSHVSQGLNTVLESSIGGIPDPEEMARITTMEDAGKTKHEESEQVINDQNPNFPLTFGIGNFVSGVSHLTKLVETTGTKVISGGLGTLETIGKKTMEVLQDGDPGLKKKRAFLQLNQDKPILSQVLREAKEKAEQESEISKHSHRSAKNYETYFDDHQGLVHLEALELLSKQCSIKLQTIMDTSTGNSLLELQETLDQVKELCELPDEEEEQLSLSDIKEKLITAVTDLNVPISYDKLLLNWEETDAWLNTLNLNICDENELHQQSIETLAQLTAHAVEQFHKAGELLLVKDHRSTADEADSLVQLTSILTSFIGIVAARFSEKLNSRATMVSQENAVNSLITNVFFEAGNSSTYIQDAFQLLIPVLQVGAI